MGIVVTLGVVAVANAESFVSFSAPHTARRSAATLDPALSRRLHAASAPTTTARAIDSSLSATGAQLHFGLNHTTKLSFDDHEREGNCIEYANLFAAIFDRAAAQGHLSARAYAVHSADARFMGEVVPGRGMGEHDWVLVVEQTPSGEKRYFVDPTFYDMGLSWDIASSVHGAVSI